MKLLRRTCLGMLLLLALSVPALAGDIPSPPAPDPPDSLGVNGVIHNPEPGEIPNPPGVMGDMSTPSIAGDIQFPGIALLIAALF